MENFVLAEILAVVAVLLLVLSMLVGIRGHARDISKQLDEMAKDLKAISKGEK